MTSRSNPTTRTAASIALWLGFSTFVASVFVPMFLDAIGNLHAHVSRLGMRLINGESIVRTITVDEFKIELQSQGVKTHEDFAFKCPMCKTVQSSRDLVKSGAGNTFDEVEKYLAFSCVGRFAGAKAPRNKPDGNPCNWTLGGLFKAHELEVVDFDGGKHPRFELASPEEAQKHAALFN